MPDIKEQSTQKGITIVAGSIASLFYPELATIIATIAGSIYGLIEVIRREKA